MSKKITTVIAGVRYRLEDARVRGLVDDKNQPTAKAKELQKAYDEQEARRVRTGGRRAAGTNRRTVGSASTSPAAVEVPEGDPTDKWTVAQIEAKAAEVGVERSGDKAAKLAALQKALAGAQDGDGDGDPDA